MNYILHLSVMFTLYAILGLSLNFVVGYCGLLSLCQAAFYGVGAYVSTLLAMKAGWSFLPALGVSVIAVALLSLIVGLPSLRLKGDFFVLATLGFQVIVFSLFYNLTDLTGGPYGIPGIPRPSVLGLRVTTVPGFVLLGAVMAALVFLLHWQLTRSPYGRALRAVRDDELAAIALGKDAARLRVTAFVISASVASVAGALYASYFTYIDPTSFGLDEAIFILAVVIIGGTGNARGPLVGALIMVALPEIVRFLPIPDVAAANVRQILYGLALILAMRFRPQGIAGDYAFN